MPLSAPHPCPVPGCPGVTRERYCEAHAVARQALRGERDSSAKRGYGYWWRRLREYILRRDPLCKNPYNIPGHVALSTDVDHVIPKPEGADHPSNLQGLCHSCHARKTASEDGGFGRPRGVGGSS
jgi:5-methylcytosine-specific restriction protein A